MKANRLELNPDKAEVLLVNRKVDEAIGIQPASGWGYITPENRFTALVYSPIHPGTWFWW